MSRLKDKTLSMIATAFELTGSSLSEEGLEMVEDALSGYSDDDILLSLKLCLKQVKGKIGIPDIISRIPKTANMRPGADEAFAALPRSEFESVVWTPEMARAHGEVFELLRTDPVGARMAFREVYNRLCDESEAKGIPVQWEFSGGTDKAHRELVLKDALALGKLGKSYVKKMLPVHDEPINENLLNGETENLSDYIKNLKQKMGVNF